jgi:very-short-patch-repair endonuclease
MKHLVAAGYHVAPQWRVGSFRIDLVVEGNGKRLAIECDGDRYHPLEKLSEDMDRQSILERMGWIFSRVRSTEFFRNPGRALKPVFEKLELMEIAAAKSNTSASEKPNAAGDLIERVTRRAEKLRNAWANHESTGSRRQLSLRSAAQASVS